MQPQVSFSVLKMLVSIQLRNSAPRGLSQLGGVFTSETCVHADDVIAEARQTALVFGHKLRLEHGLAVARDVEIQFPAGRNDRFGVAAIAVVTGLALRGLGVEVVGQFGGQHAFGQLLLKLAH